MISIAQLNRIRKEKRRSYSSIADGMKMSRSQVTRWFKGKSELSLERLNDLCKELGVETGIVYPNG